MISKFIVQAVFCVQVVAISTTGRDEAQEAANIIFNTLKHLQEDVDSTSQISLNFHPPFENSPGIVSNSDKLRTITGMKNSFLRNRKDMKSKRSWEDVSFIWRTSPKRAWEVVNRLWQNPEIRRKYRSYIENGKRSEEVMENIPVQQNNENPLWMLDQLGYDPVIQLIENNLVNREEWLPKSTKRGWEAINPTIWKSKKVSSKRTSIPKNDKRGWEELNWKRNTRGSILKRLPNQEPDAFNFDSNLLKANDQGINDNQLLHPRSDILDKLLSNFLRNEGERAGNMNDNIRERIAQFPTHRKKSFPYNYQEYNKVINGDSDLHPSLFQELCRILVKDSNGCRISAKYGESPEH